MSAISFHTLQFQITNSIANYFSTEYVFLNVISLIIITYITSYVYNYIGRLYYYILELYHKFMNKDVILIFEKPEVNKHDYTTYYQNRNYDDLIQILCYYLYKNNILANVKKNHVYKSNIRHLESNSMMNETYYTKISIDSLPNEYTLIDDDIQLLLDKTQNQRQQNNNDKDDNAGNTVNQIMYLKTRKNISHLYTFLDKINTFYYKEVIEPKRNERYYMTFNSKDDIWTTYKLNKERTFDSFFHPQKQDIINLLDNFDNKTGIYKFESVTHGIGFLLYGPPGTGKTSLIKMLSHLTRRHVININLKSITKNRQLLDIFYGNSFLTTLDDGHKIILDIKQSRKFIIIEDIDCLGDIVLKREEEKKLKLSKTLANDDKEENKEDKDEETSEKSKYSFKYESDDELTLSGLLNVLQGAIDNEDLIWVMTTNHPEKLDPALIRPGRVNMKIHLDYIQIPQIIEMLQYYYPNETITDEIKEITKITPSYIEMLCVTYKSAKEVIALLNTAAAMRDEE